MARQHIYTVLSGTSENWSVVKMERDHEPIETYYITKSPNVFGQVCTCFAGSKETCRHRTLLKIFQQANAIDSRRAYDFDKDKWIDPPKAYMAMME